MQLRKLINSSPFSRYVGKKLKQLPVLTDLVVMGKGRELSKIGYNFSSRTVHVHLQALKKRYKTIKLKPLLTSDNKKKRVRYALDRVDKRSQHRARYKFEDSMDTIMVNESWFYLTKDSIRIMLIEDMDVLINPKVHHKDHIEKIMFLSIVARPRKVMLEGREIDFDGKIGIIPCTEDYVTKRVSKHGPKVYKRMSIVSSIITCSVNEVVYLIC